MRIYGSVQIRFWENDNIQQISDQAKLLAIYLLTGPHSNMLGCLRLPDGYITEDLRWDNSTVKQAFIELTEIDFLIRDEATNWLNIHQFLLWNPIQNPRQGIGVKKIFDQVPPSSTVYKPLVQSLIKYGKYFDESFINRLNTLSENCMGDNNQDQDQEQNQDKLIHHENRATILPLNQHSLIKSQATDVLDFLNSKTGRAYRPVEENLKLIIARLKSGVTVMDCRQVIAKKTREWKSDPKMAEYLRPATLFNATKFEQYMGEIVLPEEEQNNGTS